MDFSKIINNMKELQSKVKEYEIKNTNIENALSSIEKDIVKLEKKKEKELDEINKNILNIKILIMKDVLFKFKNNEVNQNGKRS